MTGQNTSSAVMQQRSEPHEVITLSEAREAGLRWYFSGKPCPKGHLAKRNVSNRECRQCNNDKQAVRRLSQPEVVRAKDRERHLRNIDARREQSRKSYRKNIEKRHEYERKRYADSERRAWQLQQAARWAKDNPGRRNEIIAARRARQKLATPKWLTKEQRRQIVEIYLEARSYGPGVMHVDHIVPLSGRTVCGLHVPENLRIIPADENRAKGNRYGPE